MDTSRGQEMDANPKCLSEHTSTVLHFHDGLTILHRQFATQDLMAVSLMVYREY